MNVLLHGPKFNKLIPVIKVCSVQWTSAMSMPPGPKNVLLLKAPQMKVEEILSWGKLTCPFSPPLEVWIFLDVLNKAVNMLKQQRLITSKDGDTLVKGTTENSGSLTSYWARTGIYGDILFIKHCYACCIRKLWVGRQPVSSAKVEQIWG